MRIISVDPGYDRVGVAIIEKDLKKEVLVFSLCIETSSKSEHSKRLLEVKEKLSELIEKYKPEVLAIESLFFKNNQKTAMKVAEARGVVLCEAELFGLRIFEYTPLQIKIAVTGYGKSEKEQVTDMVRRLIEIKKPIKHDDEYDAIAIGLTFFATDFRNIRNKTSM